MGPAPDPIERSRARRRQARRRRRLRLAGVALLAVAAAGGLVVVVLAGGGGQGTSQAAAKATTVGLPSPTPARPRPLPFEIRGVHVTMALASLPGRLEQYLGVPGLNTLELDVKDENGHVAFVGAAPSLARATGAAAGYYDPRRAVRLARRYGVYLIGRVVVFEDPVVAERRPGLAIGLRGGGVWRNRSGLGWANPYSRAYWRYAVDVAAAAARAGFDEIQFDYVRFPTDGDLSRAVFPGRRHERQAVTIGHFLDYAVGRLRPLRVRVSADLFGLAATRDLGIGQAVRRISRRLDAVYPMVYPSHYNPGEYRIPDPSAEPARTVAASLRDYARALRGRKTKLVPWLQDFSLGRAYGLAEVRAQISAARRARTAGFLLWNAEGVYDLEALDLP